MCAHVEICKFRRIFRDFRRFFRRIFRKNIMNTEYTPLKTLCFLRYTLLKNKCPIFQFCAIFKIFEKNTRSKIHLFSQNAQILTTQNLENPGAKFF